MEIYCSTFLELVKISFATITVCVCLLNWVFYVLTHQLPCVLRFSRANVPCVLTCSCTNVSCVITCQRTLCAYVLTCRVPCVLTCLHANVLCVLTCQHVLRAYVFACQTCLACLRGHVLTYLTCSRASVPSRAYVLMYYNFKYQNISFSQKLKEL